MAGFNFSVGGFNLGSGGVAGGAASKGCGGGCGAVFGVIFGIILIPVGFYLVYHAEVRLVDHGRIFEGITMSQPDTAKQMEGELVKIQGQALGSFLTIDEWDGQALYYRRLIEEYQEERDSEGDIERDWNTIDTQRAWVDSFSVGGVTVRPASGATNPVGEEKVYSAYKKKFETAFHIGTDPGSPEVGDQRKSVDVLDATKTVIVVGEMSGGTIQGGRSFVVSTQSEGQTLQTLKTEYKMAKWGMRAGAVFCIFFGIMAVFGPLTTLVGYIPLIGDQIGCAFAGLAFIFALVSVTIVTLFIKAFWFLVAIVVLGVAFLIIRGITTPRQKPDSGEAPPGGPAAPTPPAPPPAQEPPAQTGAVEGVPRPSAAPEPTPPETPAEPEAGPAFCANCGAKLDPGAKFCRECGQKVE